MPPPSPDLGPPQEDLPLRHRQSRVYDAEKIRREFIKSQVPLAPPDSETPIPDEAPQQVDTASSGAALQEYLRSLNQEQLDQVLNEVLTEVRTRESEQMKRDVLTHSQKLRLRRESD